jgi:hypothetical protein
MSPVDVLDIVNYGLVFVYGLFLSASIAGGCKARRERVLLYVAGSVLLLLLGGVLADSRTESHKAALSYFGAPSHHRAAGFRL